MASSRLTALVFGALAAIAPLCALPAGAARPRPALVNVAGCSLFDMKGNRLKRYFGWVCGFFPNGNLLLGDGFTLTFYDSRMNIVWSRDVHSHHVINVTPDGRTALVITSQILRGVTRIDRLEVIDDRGTLVRAFGFKESDSFWSGPQNWDKYVLPGVQDELTLIESFHQIGKNASSEPYLAEGGYLASDAGGMLYFFDPTLTRIVHRINLRKAWGVESLRDVQVTKRGTILAYNSSNSWRGKRFTTIEERDPRTGALVWSYQMNPPTAFYGSYEGNVQELPNGNFLFSMVRNEVTGQKRKSVPALYEEPWMEVQGKLRLFEVTKAGKIVWRMANDGRDLTGMPNTGRRIDFSNYLKNKGRY